MSKICDTSSQRLPHAAKSCPLLLREVKSSGNRLFSLRMQRRVLQKLASCGAGGTGLWRKRYRGRQSRVRRARRYSSQDTPTTAVEVYSSREFCRLTADGPRDQTDIIVTGHTNSIIHINRHIRNRRGQKTQTWYPYMQKAGDCGDISPQFFLDFPQNFRLRTRNQYCTQAIA